MIVMDEATSHLDMNHRLELMQIVRRMNREHGTTVLMISHDLNLTAEFCSRMVLLDQGRVSADGTPAEVLTEGRLQQVYHCDVRVQTNPASGIVAVFPTPRWLAAGSGRGVRVHIICGGGTGEEIIRRLHLADYTVTCGVLNRGDTDADTALALGIETAMERPFSPVTEAPYQIALPWIEAADTVIVSGVPFGPGNLRNLDLADRALQAGKRVMIMAGVAERDYTPDRQATLYSRRLRDRGAVEWRNIAELFTGLQP
jgi:iron complex transport system ATP-binding protein